MHLAAEGGDVEMGAMLMEFGVDINAETEVTAHTDPYHSA